LALAAELAEPHDLPISLARIHMARGETSAALAVLEQRQTQTEAKGWEDERLKILVLQAVGHHIQGDSELAMRLLGEALALAEPGGFIRLFVDEGDPMEHLLCEASAQELMPDYVAKLLDAFTNEKQKYRDYASLPATQPLIDPLSQRELEVLRLIAQGLSNREIAERLFLALTTVKGHNQRIFGKLQVQRRTEAVARARKLGLL
jgi:LuxR family maltose regulon positive regulatory protein